jgi:ribose transport system permease protein
VTETTHTPVTQADQSGESGGQDASGSARRAPEQGTRNPAQLGLSMLSRYGLAFLLIGLIVFFSAERPNSFFTYRNASSIMSNQSVIVIGGLSVLLTLIVGEFDLSIAANLSLGNALSVGLCERQHLPVGAAIVVAIAACTGVGLVNGLVVIRLQVNSFVATLGMATFLAGMSQLYTGGTDIFTAPNSLTRLARTNVGKLPLAVFYAVGVALILHILLRHTSLGRRMVSVGGNARAASLSGIPAQRYRIAAFTAGGTVAGVAGVVLGATLGSATAAGNPDLLLPIFAAAILGSTAVTPGRYNVPGLLLAVVFLAVAVSGLQQMGVAAWIQPAFNGAALVVAVALSGWATRARVAQARRRQLAAIANAR